MGVKVASLSTILPPSKVAFTIEFRSMHFGDEGDALVAAGAIDDNDPLGGTEREISAEG